MSLKNNRNKEGRKIMTKLSKVEFMEIIRAMVEQKISASSVNVNNMTLKIAILRQPYIDVNMDQFYFGYCLDTLTLSKITDIVIKLADGTKFSDDVVFESIVTRYEPKPQQTCKSASSYILNKTSRDEGHDDEEVSDEELNADSYDVQFEEQQERAAFEMIKRNRNVLLKHVYPKLVSDKKMSAYEGCVYRKVLDMFLVYYVDVKNPDCPTKTPFINKKALKELSLTEAELYAAAVENMLRNWDVFMIHHDIHESDDETTSCCFGLTHKQKTNGASVIFLPGLLNKIACLLDNNLYVIPFNSDIVMIHPVSVNNLNLLKISLAEFPGDDVLSSNVLLYNKNSDNLINV